ncbi:MAG: hypothetical protein KGI25_04910 [Thaumarchaeota archaeon]|nr:hypothetical protein [Nitrososphaerota archaeon]
MEQDLFELLVFYSLVRLKINAVISGAKLLDFYRRKQNSYRMMVNFHGKRYVSEEAIISDEERISKLESEIDRKR